MTRYAFQDEFDGPAGSPPDPVRWRYDLGGGGWGHGELQTYTDSTANVFQDGRSHLVIRATREGRPAPANGRPAACSCCSTWPSAGRSATRRTAPGSPPT